MGKKPSCTGVLSPLRVTFPWRTLYSGQVTAFEAGRVVSGRYRLEDLIGQGGMGSVYRARHVAINRPVAIKFIHVSGPIAQKQTERFLREARTAADLVRKAVQ